MQARFVFGGITSSATAGSGSSAASWTNKKPELLRLMVTKASNRATVHGHRLPPTETIIDKEEIEKDIKKGKEEKENKKAEVEKTVDSEINRSDCIYPPAT